METQKNDFNEYAFFIFSGDLKLPMRKIYDDSEKYQKDLSQYIIEKQKYDIQFTKIDEYECKIKIYKNSKLIFSTNVLLNPILLKFEEGLDFSFDDLYIYTKEQLDYLIYYYKENYRFIDDKNNYLENSNDYKDIISINFVKKNNFEFTDNIYIEFKNKANAFLDQKEANEKNDIIEIDPIILSFNFKAIFPKILIDKSFELILNEERKNFLEKIKQFLYSQKRYLWLVGSDGIGKTISLMYYALINCDSVFYINLKLLTENEKRLKKLLVNDLAKYLYFKNRKQDEESFLKTQNTMKYLANRKVFNLSKEQEALQTKYKFWIWLRNIFDIIFFDNIPSIIILDQYRDTSSDYNYQYLNNLIDFIETKTSCKLIISTSINNFDIQYNFYNNINHFSINVNDDKELNDNEPNFEDKIQNIDNDYFSKECDFYENFLNEKTTRSYEEKNKEVPEFKSDFVLNNKLKDKTIKIYYSSLVSGKALAKNFDQDEIDCFKNFNYNLKYINKYIKFKSEYIEKIKNEKVILNNLKDNKKNKGNNNNLINSNQNEINNVNIDSNNNVLENINCINNIKNDTLKKDNNSDKSDTKSIIKNFYSESHNHINEKITSFYLMTYEDNSNKKDIYYLEMYKYLRELRDVIFRKDLFNIFELRAKMKFYPGKYLRIVQIPLIWQSDASRTIQNYRIEYSNNFIRLAINEIIKHIESMLDFHNKIETDNGGGITFEKNVINAIINNKKQIFGQLKFEIRKVFSLVGKTANSKNTIEKHRNEEKNYIYEFYDVKEYSDKIDDIDYDNNSVEKQLNGNLYLILQVSKTGRSFDFAILKKDLKTGEWFLYLFQVTINKKEELRKKYQYLNDAITCESNLNSLYNINISKRYLIFVLPFYTYNKNFVNELINRQIYYIFFKANQFYDKFENVICNLNFDEAELIKKELEDIDIVQMDLQKSLNAWNDSIEKFLRRKRKNEKLSFYYSQNISRVYQQNVILKLSKEIKIKIFEALKESHETNALKYELLFIGNCQKKQIMDIFNENNFLIFFKLNGAYHFYFENLYKFDNDFFTKITTSLNLDEESKIESKSKSKNKPKFNTMSLSNSRTNPINSAKTKYKNKIITLSELDEQIDLCFCYRILG